MGKKKAKSGNYWKLACIVMADYVRALVNVQHVTCKTREELDLYIQMVMNCSSIIKRDGSVIIQSDDNTQTNTKEVLQDLQRVENDAVMQLQTFDFAMEYKNRKSVIVEGLEGGEFKKLPTKLLGVVTILINKDDNMTFTEFTHGAGTYRLVRISSGRSFILMSYSKKLNSWSDRAVLTAKKV